MGVQRRQGRARLIGRRIAISVMIGLIVGLSFGLFLLYVDLLYWPDIGPYGPSDWLRDGSIYGMVIGLGSLLLQFMSQGTSQRTLSAGSYIQTVHGQRALLGAVVVGLIYGLGDGLSVVLRAGMSKGLSVGLINGLGTGLFVGLRFGLISVLTTAAHS